MKIPDMIMYRRVDEIIECYDVADSTTAELLELMPDAYGGELPGEDDWPEPDSKRDAPYKLSKIWDKLSDKSQSDIALAVEKSERRVTRLTN